MRKRLVKLPLNRALPDEDFFLAGPARKVARTVDGRQAALLADLRRQRRAQSPLAA